MAGKPRYEPLAAPSILAGDHANLAESARVAGATEGVRWLHIDIMDGHFVPNLTFGPQTVAALRPRSELFFDVHLMLDNPWEFTGPFIQAGAQNVTIHVEPTYPVDQSLPQVLKSIREQGACCGLSLNPDTPLHTVKPFLGLIDLLLVMTVVPGFGGQSFREDVLPKIQTANTWREEGGHNFRIEVDGGVDSDTGPRCARAGADTFVAGSAFFKASDKARFVAALQTPV